MRLPTKLVALVLCIALLYFSGCGGNDQAGTNDRFASDQIGEVVVTIAWPARTQSDAQAIPDASNAINVRVLESPVATTPVAEATLVRPQTPPWTTSTTIGHVPASDRPVVLLARAFPTDQCSGVAQARASLDIIVPPCDYAYPATGSPGDEIVLTLASTITEVQVTPRSASVGVDQTVQLTATARNEDGDTVLVPAEGGFTWEVIDGGAFASVDQDGLVRGIAQGTATVRATETESEEGNRKSGTAEVRVYSRVSALWSYEGEGLVEGPPAVGPDGTIYVAVNANGGQSRALHAVNPDGTKKWQLDVSVQSSPAVGPDGTIFIGTDFGVLAVDPGGVRRWEFPLDCLSTGCAIGADGTVFVGSEQGDLHAINPNGTEKWRFSAASYITGTPAIAGDGTVLFGTGTSESTPQPCLYAIYPDGTEKWRLTLPTTSMPIGGSSDMPAVGSDGTVYVSYDGLLAVAPQGELKWRFGVGHCMQGNPAIGPDGTIYVGSYDQNIYAVEPDGTEKWCFATDREIWATPAIGQDGTVYAASTDGNLYAIADDGSEQWRYETDADFVWSPAIASGRIFVAMHAWDHPTRFELAALRVVGHDVRLSNGPWPMYGHDPSHTCRVGAPLQP